MTPRALPSPNRFTVPVGISAFPRLRRERAAEGVQSQDRYSLQLLLDPRQHYHPGWRFPFGGSAWSATGGARAPQRAPKAPRRQRRRVARREASCRASTRASRHNQAALALGPTPGSRRADGAALGLRARRL